MYRKPFQTSSGIACCKPSPFFQTDQDADCSRKSQPQKLAGSYAVAVICRDNVSLLLHRQRQRFHFSDAKIKVLYQTVRSRCILQVIDHDAVCSNAFPNHNAIGVKRRDQTLARTFSEKKNIERLPHNAISTTATSAATTPIHCCRVSRSFRTHQANNTVVAG